jgi:outer membrane immunogenic protein
MKRRSIGILAFALTGVAALASANAADLAVQAPVYKAPVYKAPPPVFSWTGFYLGVQGGGAWGDSVQFFTGGTTDRYKISGGEAGGTVGYNWQFSPHFVVGIEADYAWAHITGTGATSLTYNCGTVCATTVDSLGTVRGRLGYAFDNVLLYGTGGLAFSRINSNLNGFTAAHDRTGWTAGAGIEYAFNPHWSVKAEYLRVNFDSYVWTNATVPGIIGCGGVSCSTDAKFNVVRAGVNYKF